MLELSRRSLDYLIVQRGHLSDLRGEPQAWLTAYHLDLETELAQVRKYVRSPRKILDIGSGLGGIDVRLIQDSKTSRLQPHAVLIDGEDEPPKMLKHDTPFCSRDAVDEFMRDNHIAKSFYTYASPGQVLPDRWYDLVMSFRSWCFHYAPEQYLDYVLKHVDIGGIIIVDVRKGRTDWYLTLCKHLSVVATIKEEFKYCRIVFRKEK